MKQLLPLLILFTLTACEQEENPFDASGTFEAVETIISAEAAGVIQQLQVEEGQELQAGQAVGNIDSMQLFLSRKQVEAQLKAAGKRLPNIGAQTSFYNQQAAVTKTRLDNLLREQKRIQNLVNADAATPKQLDDITGQIAETRKQLEVYDKQKSAQVSALQTQSSATKGTTLPLLAQIDIINNQLAKCRIVNPIKGTVLTKFAEVNEMTSAGKPLYKIADLATITLRAYITGNQLPTVKLNQKVPVFTDDGQGGYVQTEGVIYWINDKAEFTPKTVQTKEERANKVYAIKVRVQNDGRYKIGMYGELKFEDHGGSPSK